MSVEFFVEQKNTYIVKLFKLFFNRYSYLQQRFQLGHILFKFPQ